eukprot:291774_1
MVVLYILASSVLLMEATHLHASESPQTPRGSASFRLSTPLIPVTNAHDHIDLGVSPDGNSPEDNRPATHGHSPDGESNYRLIERLSNTNNTSTNLIPTDLFDRIRTSRRRRRSKQTKTRPRSHSVPLPQLSRRGLYWFKHGGFKRMRSTFLAEFKQQHLQHSPNDTHQEFHTLRAVERSLEKAFRASLEDLLDLEDVIKTRNITTQRDGAIFSPVFDEMHQQPSWVVPETPHTPRLNSSAHLVPLSVHYPLKSSSSADSIASTPRPKRGPSSLRRNDTRPRHRSHTHGSSPLPMHLYDGSLLGQYWWVLPLIGSVIIIWTVTSCTLFIKQHTIDMHSIQQNHEEMNHVVINSKKNSKAHTRSRKGRKQRGYNLMEVDIERTLSEQAPCRVWMICDKIGRGRFGTVRLAIDPNNPLTSKPMFYAVKRARFNVDKGNGGSEVLSIFHEIVILSKLNHPNVVKYYGNGVANEHICLFLEWCSIGSMADILAVRKSFSIPRIHHYLCSLLSAIDYLHLNQIYHRDIKARNILLCSDGTCKLADLGSAVDCSDHGRQSDANRVPTAGTIHWMPPEAFLNRNENFEALAAHDIWSLGVTIIEMITTCPPCFDENSTGDILRASADYYRYTFECVFAIMFDHSFYRKSVG